MTFPVDESVMDEQPSIFIGEDVGEDVDDDDDGPTEEYDQEGENVIWKNQKLDFVLTISSV